jgi:AcrR family transcriptional regulator
MRIATLADVPATDLTARARIRDAAIACFAAEGFDASFRTIAQRAGVSPGLITHHFGSKAALRTECDAEVLRQYQALKTGSLADPSAYLLQNLTGPSAAAPLVVYLLRALSAGGPPAREFLEHLIDSAREVMRAGVEAGVLRPSRDEEARLRYLTFQTMGALLIQFLTTHSATPEEFVASAQADGSNQILPTLELFTEGLLSSTRMLDDYVRYLDDPHEPATPAHPHERST